MSGQFGESQFGGTVFGGAEGTVPPETLVWRVIRNQSEVVADLYDVEVVDTANPFGNYAIAYVDDFSGTKFEDFPRGTRLDFQYSTDGGQTYTTRFSGFVVESRELDQQGADALEIEAYSFDQFLRKSVVSNDQTGNTISEALEDIITNDTPVDWVASNVTVEDDITLEYGFRGEKVENALQELRGKSANEEFGVNDNIEFFFRPQEATSAPRDIDNTEWFNYDIPEEGKRAINQVTVFFNSGNQSVTVSDGGDQLDLQDSLGTNDPISFAKEVSRPDITTIDAARDVGEKILSDNSTTLTGTVTTFGLEAAKPGEVLGVTINDRGIDTDFQIAELKYRWGEGTTQLTVVEKRGDQDTLLVNMSDTLKRVELDNVDRDAISNRVTNTNVGAQIAVTGDVDGTSYTASRYTVPGLNRLRDGWGGDGNLDITEIAVGNDATPPTRTDSGLGNELERVSVSETLPDSVTVEYDGSFTTTDIREVGLFASDGVLLARATVPSDSFSAPVTATLSLSVDNDSSVAEGVVTTAGQTTLRDIIADNSPALPTQYAYGDGTPTLAESNTSLANEIVDQDLENFLVQESDDTDPPFQGIADSVSATDPVIFPETFTDLFRVAQTCFTIEGEDYDTGSAEVNTGLPDTFSNNADVEFDTSVNFSGAEFGFEFTPDYDMPAANVKMQFRADLKDPQNDFSIWINQNKLGTITTGDADGDLEWISATKDQGTGYTGDDLAAGTTHELRFEGETKDRSDDIAANIDVVAVYDDRFSYTFDNTTTSTVDGNYLDGPELYPDVTSYVEFNNVTTRRDVTGALYSSIWNDTSGSQAIGLSNDDGSNWTTANNSSSLDTTFGTASRQIKSRARFSRYGSRTDATPLQGHLGQGFENYFLYADVDAITAVSPGVCNTEIIIPPNTIDGQTIREGAQQDSSDNLLTHVRIADIDVQADQRIYSSEELTIENA